MVVSGVLFTVVDLVPLSMTRTISVRFESNYMIYRRILIFAQISWCFFYVVVVVVGIDKLGKQRHVRLDFNSDCNNETKIS